MDGRHFFHRGKKKKWWQLLQPFVFIVNHSSSNRWEDRAEWAGGQEEGTQRAGRASISSQQKINGVSVFFYLIGEYYLEIAFDFFFFEMLLLLLLFQLC